MFAAMCMLSQFEGDFANTLIKRAIRAANEVFFAPSCIVLNVTVVIIAR